MSQTVPIENYQDLVDTAQASLMQITQQCKLMVILMDTAGIQIPHFNKTDAWMRDFQVNADRLFAKEKPWVKAGQKNLSVVVKELLLYLSKRNGTKQDASMLDVFGTAADTDPSPAKVKVARATPQ